MTSHRTWWIAGGVTRVGGGLPPRSRSIVCDAAYAAAALPPAARPCVPRPPAVPGNRAGRAHVSQPAGLALYDEMPQRDACLRDQRWVQLAVLGSGCLARVIGVELGQRSERCFKRASQPAERRRFLPGELVREHIRG